jgi:O-antigen ligase
LAENRVLSVFGAYGRDEGLLTITTYLALFWLGAQFLHNAGEARQLVRWLLAGGYLVALLGIAQSLLGSAIGVPREETAFTFAGSVRAASSLGNPNALGTLMAMLLPPALWELSAARSGSGRLLSLNCVVTVGCALILTFSRSAWLGALLGAGILVSGALTLRAPGGRVLTMLGMLGVIAAVMVVTVFASTGHAVLRLASLADPVTGSGATRLHIWRDSLSLVASRPLTGYGPDSFGLVYPRFQTGDWAHGLLIDKAHSDLVQLAATQGLLGVAAFLWMVVALLRSFWRGRRLPGAFAVLGGWAGYQVAVQLNFSYLPSAAPFWLFLAGAVMIWEGSRSQLRAVHLPGPLAAGAALGGIALPLLLVLPALVAPYLADSTYLDAQGAWHAHRIAAARDDIARAHLLAPGESAYAAYAGDLALDLDSNGEPGPGARWVDASEAYGSAAQLGSFDPAVYRHLALVDKHLGRLTEARAAALEAGALGPFDSRNRSLLRQLRSMASDRVELERLDRG